jgi:hypothetical protein
MTPFRTLPSIRTLALIAMAGYLLTALPACKHESLVVPAGSSSGSDDNGGDDDGDDD